MLRTLSTVSPYLIERAPEELFAAMPPIVARLAVNGKEQLVARELPVQLSQDHTRLDSGAAIFGVEGDGPVQPAGAVDDDALADGLATLTGAATARQDRHPLLPRESKHSLDVGHGLRPDNADGLNLVNAGVSGIATAIKGAKHDIALYRARKPSS